MAATRPLPPSLESYGLKALGRGHQPSVEDFVRAARRAKIKVPPLEDLRAYRLYYTHLANLSSKRARPRNFATVSVASLGLVFIDLAFLYPRWKKYNGGHAAFLVAVEASTQQVAAYPMRGKTSADWRQAVLRVLDESAIASVKTLVCDREPAVFSRRFRNRLLRERGVSVAFLTRRHKSYRAESMIRWIKVGLVRTVRQRQADGDPEYRCWTATLPTLIKSFNRRKAQGTRFRRADITAANYHQYINELFQTEDASLLFNSAAGLNADRLFSNRWLKRLFKFDVGDTVLVHRSATRQHGEAFPKPSERGSFAPEPAVVVSRWLKRSLKQFLVPGTRAARSGCGRVHSLPPSVAVYYLADAASGSRLDGFYYREELLRLRGQPRRGSSSRRRSASP